MRALLAILLVVLPLVQGCRGCEGRWIEDTSAPAVDAGAPGIGVVPGGGTAGNATHRLELTVGDPMTVDELRSDEYRLQLGVGAMRPR